MISNDGLLITIVIGFIILILLIGIFLIYPLFKFSSKIEVINTDIQNVKNKFVSIFDSLVENLTSEQIAALENIPYQIGTELAILPADSIKNIVPDIWFSILSRLLCRLSYSTPMSSQCSVNSSTNAMLSNSMMNNTINNNTLPMINNTCSMPQNNQNTLISQNSQTMMQLQQKLNNIQNQMLKLQPAFIPATNNGINVGYIPPYNNQYN